MANKRSASADPQNEFEIGLLSARGFLEAAKRCVGEPPELLCGRPRLVTPATVCAAFACELALKCVLLKESGAPTSGHELQVLFDAAPARIQQRISSAVTGLRGASIDVPFDKTLKLSSSAFAQWRYHYEDGGSWSPDVHRFLIDLGNELISVAQELA